MSFHPYFPNTEMLLAGFAIFFPGTCNLAIFLVNVLRRAFFSFVFHGLCICFFFFGVSVLASVVFLLQATNKQ